MNKKDVDKATSDFTGLMQTLIWVLTEDTFHFIRSVLQIADFSNACKVLSG